MGSAAGTRTHEADMRFKNLALYQLADGWRPDFAEVSAILERRRFIPCGTQDHSSSGWVQPTDTSGYVYSGSAPNQWLICLQTEQRLMPASVVKQVTGDRAKEIQNEQGYKPGRKQMREIKEAVEQELLPQAFKLRRRSYAWLDLDAGTLAIDTASDARANDVIEALHDAIDNLPLRLIDTERSPTSLMVDMLTGGDYEGFTVDRDCELRATTDEKASVRYARHPLDGKDVPEHLAAGKVPTRLALTYDDRVSFVITERFSIRRVAMLDLVQEATEEIVAQGGELFDADFYIQTSELQRMIPALISALGGPRRQEKGDLVDKVEGDDDPLYDKAVEVVLASGRPSISLIQRHLQTGYNRAARLLETMEARGVVSPMNTTGVRQVLA